MEAAFARITRMMEAYANNGASGEQIVAAYHTTSRTLPNLAPSVARLIEDRALPGTVWADAYEILAN